MTSHDFNILQLTCLFYMVLGTILLVLGSIRYIERIEY